MEFDIFVRTCDKNLTLGSVVPLAMFLFVIPPAREGVRVCIYLDYKLGLDHKLGFRY